jgi:cell fate (sporulation/competence/biofilm development) regulator YmcA (YheA/YmcA/DUF963 family)
VQRSNLGLTETQAETPINVNGKMWTLEAIAEFLYRQRRTENPDREKIAAISDELAQLQKEALELGDRQLIGAADALEKSARGI